MKQEGIRLQGLKARDVIEILLSHDGTFVPASTVDRNALFHDLASNHVCLLEELHFNDDAFHGHFRSDLLDEIMFDFHAAFFFDKFDVPVKCYAFSGLLKEQLREHYADQLRDHAAEWKQLASEYIAAFNDLYSWCIGKG